MAGSPTASRRIAVNRKALRDFLVIERLEAGIQLRGTEVKSVRAGGVNLTGSFARVENGELFLQGLSISPYECGNRFNHEPDRPRRLLVHRKQALKLQAQVEQKGLTLVPLAVYLSPRGIVKVDLGVCRGKQQHDKRETIRRREADRDAARAMG